MLAALGILIMGTILGGSTEASFTPEIFISPLSWGYVFYGILMFLPAGIEGKEALQWRLLQSKT